MERGLETSLKSKLAEGKRKTHRSPHSRIVFEPMREIAEKLKLLAREAERMTREFAISTPITGSVGAPRAQVGSRGGARAESASGVVAGRAVS